MVMSCGVMSVVLPRECGCSDMLSHGYDDANAKREPHAGSYSGLYTSNSRRRHTFGVVDRLAPCPSIYMSTPMFVYAQNDLEDVDANSPNPSISCRLLDSFS